MTKFIEKRIINYATQIFTITEAQQTFYKKKYGITTVVLSHSVDFSLVNRRTSHEKTLSNKSYKIIAYSGSIYPQMNLDSLQRLIQAASTIKEYDIRIIFFTSVSKEVLAKWNLLNSKVEVKFVSTPELLSLLDEADILFLPLAFTNCDYLEVQTVFPTKTLEYLLAQTPILVHAPKGSYLADYASAKNFGYVVDRPDVSQLREGILRLLKDDNLRSQLISGAKKAASERDSRCVVNILKYHLLNCT
jgi:glycosyltransferase involved in cell wall biosynthesis